MKKLIALVGLLLLTACGPSKLDTAQANYEQCLTKHAADPRQCDGLRSIYETQRRDEREWGRQVERDENARFNAGSPSGMVTSPNTCVTPGRINCN